MESDIKEGAELIRKGKLVAFPTETVYGLGADATNARAVERIFTAKERPATNPVIVHVSSIEMAKERVSGWNRVAEILARTLWPGPLTLILPKKDEIPDVVTGGLETVGVRLPGNETARSLIEAADRPIAAPSANPYQGISPTTPGHVRRGLDEKVDYILARGKTEVGLESTVVAVDCTGVEILRPGRITEDMLHETLPSGIPVTMEGTLDDRRSPGTDERHYAPEAHVELVDAPDAVSSPASGDGFVLLEGSDARPDRGNIEILPADPDGFAEQIYAALHNLDEAGCRRIYIEKPPREKSWAAIWDRISRAAD